MEKFDFAQIPASTQKIRTVLLSEVIKQTGPGLNDVRIDMIG